MWKSAVCHIKKHFGMSYVSLDMHVPVLGNNATRWWV